MKTNIWNKKIKIMAYDLKKESEVKEYIDKLGVEYRFGCYSEKKPEGEWVLNQPNLHFEVTIGFLRSC